MLKRNSLCNDLKDVKKNRIKSNLKVKNKQKQISLNVFGWNQKCENISVEIKSRDKKNKRKGKAFRMIMVKKIIIPI